MNIQRLALRSKSHKTAFVIPNIDKWDKWSLSILEEIRQMDYAILDAPFFDESEIDYRDIRQIPNLFVMKNL